LPRESQTLVVTAPSQPGVYPYVCTYPGHWRRMYGSLYVVEDLDDYLAEPETYLARHPLPIKDELLRSNRPRKDWASEAAAPEVGALDKGRRFANAKQMFRGATGVACHKLNGVGEEFGPDFTKLDAERLKPLEILRSVLEPSQRIDDKYRTF